MYSSKSAQFIGVSEDAKYSRRNRKKNMNFYKINLFVSFISLIVATIYLIFFSDIDISIIIPGVLFLVVLLIMAILLKVKSK